jgi:hypothetical protein
LKIGDWHSAAEAHQCFDKKLKRKKMMPSMIDYMLVSLEPLLLLVHAWVVARVFAAEFILEELIS